MRIPNEWRGKEGLAVEVRFTAPGMPATAWRATVAELAKGRPSAGTFCLAAAEAGKDSAEARMKVYAEAVAAWPDDVQLLNSYAWDICTDPRLQQRDTALAVRLAKHAVELTRRERAYIIDTLAEALLLAGSLDEAEKANAEAIAAGEYGESTAKRRERIAAARKPEPECAEAMAIDHCPAAD